jgi:hypothetical protein
LCACVTLRINRQICVRRVQITQMNTHEGHKSTRTTYRRSSAASLRARRRVPGEKCAP